MCLEGEEGGSALMRLKHSDGYAAVGPVWGSVALKNLQHERESKSERVSEGERAR